MVRRGVVSVWLLALVGCGDGCEQLREARVVCAREGDAIGADQHALCSDSSMCNGIEWCDPTHPLRDDRNCVNTQPCDTRALQEAFGVARARACFEPSGEASVEGLYGAPLRACRVTGCEEEACYSRDDGLILRGARWVDPLPPEGVLEHDGFEYDIACLRGVCVNALCRDDEDCEDDTIDCNGEEVCEPRIGCVHTGDPCQDLEPRSEGGEWVCIDGREDVCVWECMDADGDGWSSDRCGGYDCDDDDPDRYPSNEEVCDPGHDEDCDPTTIGQLDYDGDGYVDANCGNVTDDGERWGTDCDDEDPKRNPGQHEVCNGIDDDCNGDDDDGVLQQMFVDADGDGFGVPGSASQVCPGPGLSYVAGDCDDDNPQIIPGALVCVDPGNAQLPTYDLCTAAGVYTKGSCAGTCIGQPNGTGVCH